METPVVLKYVGRKVRIVCRNGYNYTCIIPKHRDWTGEKSFRIKDKFGENVDLDVEFIMVINEINESTRRDMQ